MSSPTWRLTIDTTDTRIVPGGAPNRWVVEGSGALPFLERLTPSPEPGPPVGDRYAPQPGEDTSPFVFPTDGPRYQTRDWDRNYPLGLTPPGSDYYAVEAGAGNPSIMSHVNAGIIAADGMTDYGMIHPARAVGWLRLWVRAVPGEDFTGRPLPPAPGYLIRRALRQGHL